MHTLVRRAIVSRGCPGILAMLAVVLLQFLGEAQVLAQTLSRDQMKTITRLSCVFPIESTATWSAETAELPRIKTDAALAFEIEDIDTVDGSARLVGPKDETDVIAKLFAWSLHFLETNASGGGINVTTVFAQESRDGKLRAVHSRADYLPAAGARAADASASQFYGECDVIR
jgi:hypothetical protein